MITLTILLIVALLCVLVGCLTGLLTLVGVLASLFVGVLVGALAGYLAGRFMGTETSLGRNILMGVLGSFVGEFLFGLLGIHASGSFSSFAISVASRPLSFQSSAPASASGSARRSLSKFFVTVCRRILLPEFPGRVRRLCFSAQNKTPENRPHKPTFGGFSLELLT